MLSPLRIFLRIIRRVTASNIFLAKYTLITVNVFVDICKCMFVAECVLCSCKVFVPASVHFAAKKTTFAAEKKKGGKKKKKKKKKKEEEKRKRKKK